MSNRPRARVAIPVRSAAGFVATELVLGIGVLLVPVALVVLTLPTWSERQTTARAVAREVARTIATEGVCDTAAADRVAAVMASNLGMRAGDLAVAVGCVSGAPLDPGSDLEARVTVRMPAVHLFGVGDLGEWTWTARHRQPVDVYVGAP